MYSSLISAQPTLLWAKRAGWFNGTQLITDGTHTFGEIAFRGFKQRGIAEFGDATWEFVPAGIFSRKIDIYRDDEYFATATYSFWGTEIRLTFPGKTDLVFSKTGFFINEYVWHDSQRGDVLSVRAVYFSSKSLEIEVKDSFENNPKLALMVFLGVYYLISKRRKAAHAAHS